MAEGISSASLAAGTAADLENKAAQTGVLKSQEALNLVQASKVQQEERTSRASAGEIAERTREITNRLDTLIDRRNEQWWRAYKLSQEAWHETKRVEYGFPQEMKESRSRESLNYARAELARTDAQYHKALTQLSLYDQAKAKAYSDYYQTQMGRDEPKYMRSAEYGEKVTGGLRNLGLRLPTGGDTTIINRK